MNRTRKITALLLAGVFFLFSLSSCAGKSEKAVGVCGDYEILYEELRFEALLYRNAHPDCTEDELQAAVKQALCESYAILSLCAEHLPHRGLDSADMGDLVDEAEDSFIEYLENYTDYKNYKSYLKENNMTKHLMRHRLAIAQLQLELEEKLFQGTDFENEKTLLKWLDDGNFVRVRKIYFPLTDKNGVSLREDAEKFYKSLQIGRDPKDLLTSELDAAGVKYRAAEYVYRDLDDSDISDAALNLDEIGDISDLITAEDGYYIVIRVEDERETMVTFQLKDILTSYRSIHLEKLIQEAAAKLTVEWNEYGSELKLTEIK